MESTHKGKGQGTASSVHESWDKFLEHKKTDDNMFVFET